MLSRFIVVMGVSIAIAADRLRFLSGRFTFGILFFIIVSAFYQVGANYSNISTIADILGVWDGFLHMGVSFL